MAVTDPATEISELSSKLGNVEAVLNPDAMAREADGLREQAADPNLWGDQERAQAVTRRLSYLEGEMGRLNQLRRRLDDARVGFELADSEGDESMREEADRELTALRKEIDQLEVRTLLSGEYDAREALISINAQAGGADAADFAQNLQRMYLRWAERHGYPTEVYYTSYAEEAGIKSTTFAVHAPYAYGTLRGEHGTHRMVRISKYDNQGRRQTSFAGVDVIPVVEQNDDIEIPEDEIRVDVYRSSGPGGQGVNTTDSAVRLTHLPTWRPATRAGFSTVRSMTSSRRRSAGCVPRTWRGPRPATAQRLSAEPSVSGLAAGSESAVPERLVPPRSAAGSAPMRGGAPARGLPGRPGSGPQRQETRTARRSDVRNSLRSPLAGRGRRHFVSVARLHLVSPLDCPVAKPDRGTGKAR